MGEGIDPTKSDQIALLEAIGLCDAELYIDHDTRRWSLFRYPNETKGIEVGSGQGLDAALDFINQYSKGAKR